MTRLSLARRTLALLPLLGALGSPVEALAADTPDASAVTATPPTPGDPAAGANANFVMLPTVAVASGPTWALAPTTRTTLAVDVTVGAVIGWPRGRTYSHPKGVSEAPLQNEERFLKATLWLQPELGYSYQHGLDGAARSRGHLGSLGIGLGYGSLFFSSVSYTPRLVVGALGDELAVGLRHGVAGHFLGRLFVVELSHQMLWTGGEPSHELRLLLGLNAGALVLGWL